MLAGLAPNTDAQDATAEVVTSHSFIGPVPEFITEGSQQAIFKSLRLSAMQSQAVSFRVCFVSSLSNLNLFINIEDPVTRIVTSDLTLINGCHDSSIPDGSRNGPEYQIFSASDDIDEPDEMVTLTFTDVPGTVRPAGVAAINLTTTVAIRDDDPTVVSLARVSGNAVSEGGKVEFTVALGRTLIASEIIDVPLIISGTNITTADWILARKTGNSLNTGVTLVNETTATPVVRFSGVGAQTATLLLTAVADNTAETGGSEMLTLELGPNDATANGFDLNTRMTNVSGGADPNSDAANNTFSVTINDSDMIAPIPDVSPLEAINEQCELSKTQLGGMAPTATDDIPGTVMVTYNITNFPITSDTTIIWTYTDASNNTATQTQQVTIRDTMSADPDNDDLRALTAVCSLAVNEIPIPTATDNCDAGKITATTTITPPITASTTIMWTYRDAAGNTATQTQEVIIADNIAPSPNPSNNLSEIMRQCLLRENELTTPAASDNCTGSVTVTNDVTSFPVMESRMITWTYTDGANNTATQTQRVTIADTTDPVPVAADLPTLEDCSQITSLTVPVGTDNCDGPVPATTTTVVPISESTMITWTYTDVAGNMVTQTQEVIIGDTKAPIPDNSDLPTLTGICPVATLTDLTAPTATDNCDDGTITATTDASFPLMQSTTITWTYTDPTGNTATQTQEVICPLSIADDKAEEVIFPNPSGRYLEVQSSVEATFQLLSLNGKSLLEGPTNTRVDITTLQSGLYLVQLPDGRLLKFIKE